MAHGSTTIDGKSVPFGFFSVEDWFNSIIMSFPAPWVIGPDTHYGAEIYDARGKHLFDVWLPFGKPSARQRGDMSDEQWSDYANGAASHWESETQWHIVNAIVAARGVVEHVHHASLFDDTAMALLRSLIMLHARWNEDINAEIICGGPDRRITDDDPRMPDFARRKK